MAEDGIDDDTDEKVDKSIHDADKRDAERREIYHGEGSIKDFEVEPEIETCMTDFYQKPYAGKDDYGYQVKLENENDRIIPINFYDNDDGFWNSFIDEKMQRWDEHDVLTKRSFFKH